MMKHRFFVMTRYFEDTTEELIIRKQSIQDPYRPNPSEQRSSKFVVKWILGGRIGVFYTIHTDYTITRHLYKT